MLSYYLAAFKDRCFARDPIGTAVRGMSYIIHSRTHQRPTFEVPFGPVKFNMRLQHAKKHFGVAGIFVKRQYYESLLEFGHTLIAEGDGVVDGGASQGIFTCAFAKLIGDQGRVYAFEPQPYATVCLKENCRLNGLANVEIFEGALSKESAEGVLDLSLGPVSASITREVTAKSGLRVKTYAIDDLRAQGRMRPLSFIKLDVEGAELDALMGARETIEQDKPRICVEALDERPFQQVGAFLESRGYRPFVFRDAGVLSRFEPFEPTPNVFFLR
jgi:FkbM family methyltransferase